MCWKDRRPAALISHEPERDVFEGLTQARVGLATVAHSEFWIALCEAVSSQTFVALEEEVMVLVFGFWMAALQRWRVDLSVIPSADYLKVYHFPIEVTSFACFSFSYATIQILL